MDSMTGSQRLRTLAQQLQFYKAPISSSSNFGDDNKKSLAEATSQALLANITPKRAAVLVCLFEDDAGELRVILTKRSPNLSTHSGEVALPGGKREEADKDDTETAMREAKEEIGLDPSLVHVVTVMEPFVTKNLVAVVPVIGILSSKEKFKPAINVDEVEAIFDCPLEMFLKDEKKRTEKREWMGINYRIHFFDFDFDGKKYVIWGLTAAILIRVASIVYEQSSSFKHQKSQFWAL